MKRRYFEESLRCAYSAANRFSSLLAVWFCL